MPLTDTPSRRHFRVGPNLRAFAISLSGNGDRADDLVQETLLRAIANIDSFQPGSNLPAWLFTILRNLFRSDYRKRRREVEDVEGNYAKTLKTQPSKNAHLEFEEFRAALDKLPQDQREALILVGASGFSYEDAAAICGCAVGTIKSRVNRARSKLSALLYVEGAEDFGPDNTDSRRDRRQRLMISLEDDMKRRPRWAAFFVADTVVGWVERQQRSTSTVRRVDGFPRSAHHAPQCNPPNAQIRSRIGIGSQQPQQHIASHRFLLTVREDSMRAGKDVPVPRAGLLADSRFPLTRSLPRSLPPLAGEVKRPRLTAHRRGKLSGAVALVHVDDGFHRRDELVDVADVGEVALGGAAQRLRRDAVEQDQAEITVLAPRRLRGVELLPTEMEDRLGLLAGDLPMGDDMRMLADQRQALVGMRGQLEEQQRQALRGAR